MPERYLCLTRVMLHFTFPADKGKFPDLCSDSLVCDGLRWAAAKRNIFLRTPFRAYLYALECTLAYRLNL